MADIKAPGADSFFTEIERLIEYLENIVKQIETGVEILEMEKVTITNVKSYNSHLWFSTKDGCKVEDEEYILKKLIDYSNIIIEYYRECLAKPATGKNFYNGKQLTVVVDILEKLKEIVMS